MPARLFTALWPSAEAVHALHAELTADRQWPPEGWRPVPTARWHVTLSFHGDAEAGVLARRLEARAEGLAAPWLRLAGSVSLPRVAAAGVLSGPLDPDADPGGPADPAADPTADPGRAAFPTVGTHGQALAALAAAAGADPSRFLPHVTVGRTSRRDDRPPFGGPLARHRGPWWRPEEVHLVLSESTSAGPRYSVLHRVPLVADASAPPRTAPHRIERPRTQRPRRRPPSSGPVARPA